MDTESSADQRQTASLRKKDTALSRVLFILPLKDRIQHGRSLRDSN